MTLQQIAEAIRTWKYEDLRSLRRVLEREETRRQHEPVRRESDRPLSMRRVRRCR